MVLWLDCHARVWQCLVVYCSHRKQTCGRLTFSQHCVWASTHSKCPQAQVCPVVEGNTRACANMHGKGNLVFFTMDLNLYLKLAIALHLLPNQRVYFNPWNQWSTALSLWENRPTLGGNQRLLDGVSIMVERHGKPFFVKERCMKTWSDGRFLEVALRVMHLIVGGCPGFAHMNCLS